MRSVLLFLMAFCATAADDPWAKVAGLSGGTEVRIIRAGKQPLIAKFDEVTADNVLVVVKNEQVAIPKKDIDRLDYRPASKASRVKSESKTTPPSHERPPTQYGGAGASTSTSSSVSFVKQDFETIYRR